METCVLCNEDIENGKAKVTIKEKGSQGINKASKEKEKRRCSTHIAR